MINLSKPKECTTQKVNPNTNYVICMIMMCQCGFISCKKCTTLMGDVDSGEDYACVGAGDKWKISGPSTQFCCEPKTALKIKSIKTISFFLPIKNKLAFF